MDLFKQKTVFNPSLLGQAIYLEGKDRSGREYSRVLLVQEVNDQSLLLTCWDGSEVKVYSDDFNKAFLKMYEVVQSDKQIDGIGSEG